MNVGMLYSMYANVRHALLPGVGLKNPPVPVPAAPRDAQSSLDQHRSVCSKGHSVFPGSQTCLALPDLANGTRGQSCLPSAYLR